MLHTMVYFFETVIPTIITYVVGVAMSTLTFICLQRLSDVAVLFLAVIFTYPTNKSRNMSTSKNVLQANVLYTQGFTTKMMVPRRSVVISTFSWLRTIIWFHKQTS